MAQELIDGLMFCVGTITEWTTPGRKIMVDHEEYVKMPKQDKWMAHATMPVTAFFRFWKRKFEKLVWMALYNPRAQQVQRNGILPLRRSRKKKTC